MRNSSEKNPGPKTNSSDTQVIGKKMMMIAWLIAIGLATWLFGNWEEKQYNPNQSPQSYRNQNSVEVVLERNRAGHYLANGSVNGQQALFLLDTGATLVAIPGQLQKTYGLLSGQMHYTQTANGTAKAYATVIDSLTLGGITLTNVRASIVPNMQGNEILLGMSALKQLEFTQKGRQLTLRQRN